MGNLYALIDQETSKPEENPLREAKKVPAKSKDAGKILFCERTPDQNNRSPSMKSQRQFITRLTKDDESFITDPKEILEEQRRFYSKLYSSQNPRVNDPRFNSLFTGDMIKTLDDEQKESCEGLLTVEECKEALKNFSKNKSPGRMA